MTVRELIDLLQTHDPELQVVTPYYDRTKPGFWLADGVDTMTVRLVSPEGSRLMPVSAYGPRPANDDDPPKETAVLFLTR